MSIKVCLPPVGQSADVLTSEALTFVDRLHREFGPTHTKLVQERINQQRETPALLPETEAIRTGDWRISPAPDLQLSHVLDLEDGTSPTWHSWIGALASLPQEPAPALRPRGLHLSEGRMERHGRTTIASLLDTGLYLFHCARRLLARGWAPCLSLPKLESHREAQFWHELLSRAESWLDLPDQSVRVIVQIETVGAAFQMEEILYHLRGRTDGMAPCHMGYLTSLIRTFPDHPTFLLPEQQRLNETLPALRALTDRLVRTCARRGARPLCRYADCLEDPAEPRQMLQIRFPIARVTEAGLRGAMRLTLRHFAAWLSGAPLPTSGVSAELARSLLWQWVHHGVRVDGDGPRITPALIRLLAQEERAPASARAYAAQELLEQVVLGDALVDHFAVPGYHYLDQGGC